MAQIGEYHAAVPDELKRTPLYDAHKALGGRMVRFAGWEMPVQYTGIIDEHRACRQAAGLFDVSHMGEVAVQGPRALEAVQRLFTNAVVYGPGCGADAPIMP